ncbi:hypothetical protein ACQKHK_11830 [Staphylococcus capitis]|uniref:hypothetical protein n=1 Tax=Staphylococcus capitis TaxID=29388 RepID=UPI003D011280
MADFSRKILSDFYKEHKDKLTSDEDKMIEKYLNKYSDDHIKITPADMPYVTLPEHVLPSDMKPEVTKDTTGKYTVNDLPIGIGIVDEIYPKPKRVYKLDINDLDFGVLIIEDVYPKARVSEAKTINKKLKPLDNHVYPKKPTVRKRRKQWGGVKTYRTYELNAGKSMGYAMRSMKRHLPHIVPYSIKRATERMKRSIAHLYFKIKIEPIETRERRMTLDLFNAYEQFAHYLFEQEQEDTSAKTDAWDTYIPSNALDDFIHDNYRPTMIAFSELPALIRKFIAEEWTKYGIEAHEARQETYGYNLSQSQVSELQDSDKSFLKEMI